MTVGILTEKPSAARAFAAALGGMQGTYQGTDYVIAHARGHLYELAQPEAQLKNPSPDAVTRMKSWELSHLPWDLGDFKWDYVPIKGSNELLRDIKSKLAGCSTIVCATDVDPSGEGGMIFANVIFGLGLDKKPIERMYFTDEAAPSLQKAFLGRKSIPDLRRFDEYQMASFRSALDFGTMQFTRIATKSAGQAAVLRQGRLKSAIVKLVGDQLEAYTSYKRVAFFENRFRDENGVLYSNPAEPNFPTEAEVPQGYTTSPVVLDGRSNKFVAPRRLLDLAGLSARLSSKGIKADQVLATYQKMYENRVVSYPRTDDKTITTEQFNELLPLVNKIAAVVGVQPAVLTQRTPRKTHVKDSGAHGANRPGPEVPGSLDELKAKYGAIAPVIYEELARSYLAMLAGDYVYEAQEGHLEKYPAFKGRAAVPKDMGWKQVFVDGDDEVDENAAGLGTNADPFVFEGQNKRPEHPTMKWLMKQLEKRDVGTGATRTSTYAEVTSAKAKFPLLAETRGKITMSEFGDMSFRLLPDTHIGDLGMTEHVYAEMREIAAGRRSADEALKIVAEWVTADIETMQRNAGSMRQELGLSEVKQAKEKFEGPWSVTGEHIKFSREWGGGRFTDDECMKLLAGEEISITRTSARTGNPYNAKGKLEAQVFKSEGKSHNFIGFKPDFSGIPDVFLTHKFTADEKKSLEAGKKIFVEGMVGKKGKPFDATVSYGKKPDGSTGLILDFGK